MMNIKRYHHENDFHPTVNETDIESIFTQKISASSTDLSSIYRLFTIAIIVI